ncbi:hypothetical protein VPHD472_0069 [Vibrio phage D472]
MSSIHYKLAVLKSRFTYKTDIAKFGRKDSWTVMASDGPIEGDCEDFALTLAVSVYGSLWEARKAGAKFIWCRYVGLGHIVLKTPDGYADNIQRDLFDIDDREEYTDARTMPYFSVFCLVWFHKLRNKLKL